MAEERNTRREILKKVLTLGPVAALAVALGGNGAKPAEAATYNEDVIISTGYKLGVGITPEVPFHVRKDEDGTIAYFATHSDNGAAPQITLRRSRHTAGTPWTVGDGDVVGFLIVQAYSSPYYDNTAQIRVEVDGSFTEGQRPPSRLLFCTNEPNAGGQTRMLIDRHGNVGIQNTSPSYPLDVTGDIRVTGQLIGKAQKAYYDT